MNGRYNAEHSGWHAMGEIISAGHAANEPWRHRQLSALARSGSHLDIEDEDLLCDLECLRAELRHLKEEMQRTAIERDMLRNANRIIAVTIQAQQQRRGSSVKGHQQNAKKTRSR
jgi:hypothetical protein